MKAFAVLLLVPCHAFQLLRNAAFLQRSNDTEEMPFRQKMYNFQNTQYSSDFKIGPTKIRGILDTGSFEILVLSERCETCSKTPYDHTQSQTYVKDGEIVQHVFGSGPTVSMKGYETVTVGPMAASNQTFYEIVKHGIQVLETASFTAIVGIGAGQGGSERSLLQAYNVSVFSVCLERAPNAPGWLTWGGDVPEQDLKDKTVMLEVKGQHHWAVSMTTFQPAGVEVNGQRLCANGCAAILDSGTSLIAAPSQALMALSQQLPEIKEDCSNLADLPSINLVLDGYELVLPPEAYVMRVTGTVVEAGSLWDLLYFKPKVTVLNQCVPAFMKMDRETELGPLWILGMPFFRFFHTTFETHDDVSKRRVYLSEASPTCEPLPLSAKKTETATATNSSTPTFGTMQALSLSSKRVVTPLTMDVNSILPPMMERQGFIQV